MTILNLGCGTKTSNDPGVTNIDWSIYLRLKKHVLLRPVVPLFLRGARLERFEALPDNILVHDLARGIPFENDSVDAVYHSHMLEHLDRSIAEQFLLEARRVLKPGGIHRIVVPDLEWLCRAYLQHLEACDSSQPERGRHDGYVFALLEQSVRREAAGTGRQKKLRRFVENLVLGDARKRGETHQWMYDKVNLGNLLVDTGYKEVTVQEFDTSRIPGWNDVGLDIDENGQQYKPHSLYLEAIKP